MEAENCGQIRIILWGAPRSLTTAFLRAMTNYPGVKVWINPPCLLKQLKLSHLDCFRDLCAMFVVTYFSPCGLTNCLLKLSSSFCLSFCQCCPFESMLNYIRGIVPQQLPANWHFSFSKMSVCLFVYFPTCLSIDLEFNCLCVLVPIAYQIICNLTHFLYDSLNH